MKLLFNSAVVAVALMISGAAQAVPALDANYEASPQGSNIIVSYRLSNAQTFTVDTTGLLTSASVKIGYSDSVPTSDIQLQVRSLVGGLPSEFSIGSTVLASVSLAGSSFTEGISWVDFDLVDFAVQAGDQFAIVLQSAVVEGGGEYVWDGDFDWAGNDHPPGTYAGGQGYFKGISAPSVTWIPIAVDNGTTHNNPAGVDFSFRTFIESGAIASAAPESATWALMIGGFGMVGGALRRRRADGLVAVRNNA